ncbi:MAG TPA: OmpA family protein [Anaeromyxobacteraceae bacterium]|nr:OmpA family protein [Anaeromyxobacteraceae bacterium]
MKTHPNTESSMKLAIATILVFGVAACAHAHPASDLTVTSSQPAAMATPPATQPPSNSNTKLSANHLMADGIYFGFDSSALEPASQEILSSFGRLLTSHPDVHVRIEGNCDERGTEEYNLLLGQKRADSAKTYLLRMGANHAQIRAISYGKNRPRSVGHDEAAWRQNRRDDLVPSRNALTTKPVAVRQ